MPPPQRHAFNMDLSNTQATARPSVLPHPDPDVDLEAFMKWFDPLRNVTIPELREAYSIFNWQEAALKQSAGVIERLVTLLRLKEVFWGRDPIETRKRFIYRKMMMLLDMSLRAWGWINPRWSRFDGSEPTEREMDNWAAGSMFRNYEYSQEAFDRYSLGDGSMPEMPEWLPWGFILLGGQYRGPNRPSLAKAEAEGWRENEENTLREIRDMIDALKAIQRGRIGETRTRRPPSRAELLMELRRVVAERKAIHALLVKLRRLVAQQKASRGDQMEYPMEKREAATKEVRDVREMMNEAQEMLKRKRIRGRRRYLTPPGQSDMHASTNPGSNTIPATNSDKPANGLRFLSKSREEEVAKTFANPPSLSASQMQRLVWLLEAQRAVQDKLDALHARYPAI